MKIIKPVQNIEAKRCFVVSDFVRVPQKGKRYLGFLTPEDFEKRIKIAKKKTFKLSEKKLDKIIGDKYMPRLNAFNQLHWYLCEVKLEEVGVWIRAGGLPLSFTNKSLKDTAEKVKNALLKNSALLSKRAKRAIPNMLKTNYSLLQDEKYLFPIVLEHGASPNVRKGLKYKVKGDIDDGCMRAIALAVGGRKTLKVFLGLKRKV